MVDARRAVRRTVLGAGAALVVVGVLWRPAVVPVLVRFPTDLDQATRYSGTFAVHVDPATAAPLPSPVELPLELERRIRTVPGESGADTVVVQELVTFRIAGTEQRETHQYVMDRRSMENLDDPRSYAYEPTNVVDRSGTYRVNLPLSTEDDGRYRIWENEPGEGFDMAGLARRVERGGLALVEMEEVFEDVPVADQYRSELRKQGFATEIRFEDLAARLRAAGVDVDGALALVTGSDPAIVAEARAASLRLEFFRDNDGHALVEPRTGAIVDLLVSDEAIDVTVDLAPLDELRQVLRGRSEPAASALTGALDELDRAPPSRVYHLRYSQTADSVAEIVDLTRSELRKLDVVERWIPLLLVVFGLVLVAAGVLRRPRPRRSASDVVRQEEGVRAAPDPTLPRAVEAAQRLERRPRAGV